MFLQYHNYYFLKSILIFILLSISFCAFAQKPSLVFHKISTDDGLSENTVRSIIEDHNGFIWFGCEDGLNRYDGYDFKIYKPQDENVYSITSRSIKFLYVDKKGNLWILTGDGINIYDSHLDQFYNYKNNRYAALKKLKGDIASITEDAEGNVWIATVNDGLHKIEALNKPSIRFKVPFTDDSKFFNFVKAESDSTLFVGTRDGLLRFNTRRKFFEDLRFVYGRGYEVRNMLTVNPGTAYMSTSKGLKIIGNNSLIKEYKHNPFDPNAINGDNIVNVIPYNGDNFLIGIDGGGLDYLDVKSQVFYHYAEEVSSPNINCVYKDTKGDVWVGTFLNGINYSNITTNLFVLKKNNAYSNLGIKKGIVSSFLKDSQENLWICTDGGGIYKKAKATTEYINYEAGRKGLTSNVIIDAVEDTNGDIWFTSYGGGLYCYNHKSDSFKNYLSDPFDSTSLFNDQTKALCLYNGNIWLSGYGAGIAVFNKATGKFKRYGRNKNNKGALQSDWIQTFLVDSKGVLWLGSFNGLSRYNENTDNFTTFLFRSNQTKNLDEINSILEITEDRNGKLWLGTAGKGAICFDKEKHTYVNYTMKDGFSDNFIKSIIEDDHSNLWFSTNNGITKFNLSTKQIKAYTINDGIPSCSFFFNSKYKDWNGIIHFGTNIGFLKLDPSMTSENTRIPPVVMTSFEIFNEEVSLHTENSPLSADISETKAITLSYAQNTITFHFAALNYNSSRNNKYAYYLEGFDKSWFMVGDQRSAKYTNLNPGTYVFKVKGSNNDQVWNEEGVSVKIIITAPFWKTWWFVFAMVLFALLILYLIYIWRTSVIRDKNISLEKLVKERTNELEEANQRLETFVYKASHDIKGPLKSIIGLTTIGQKDVKDEMAKTYFDHILHSTKKLDSLLMDLLMVTKVRQTELIKEVIDFEEMVGEILSSFENLPNYKTINITTEVSILNDFSSDKKMLHSVIQNLIENPIKYQDPTKSQSFLHIKINVNKAGHAELAFKDNGLGIKQDIQKNIFDMFFKANEKSNGTGLGLYIVKSTVEKLKGTIRLESEEGKGSTFYVNI